MTNLEILIKKIELIEFKYRKLKEMESNSSRFNIFSILRDSSDEVNLHSKFIYELLNPLGSSWYERLFFKSIFRNSGVRKI